MTLPGSPLTTALFQLVVERVNVGSFSEVTGLSADVTVEEYAEGGENRFTHKFPTRASTSTLVLKRAMNVNPYLWEWFAEFEETGRVSPRAGVVELLTHRAGELVPAKAWVFVRGYPTKISGPDLNGTSATVALESVEIAHHGLSLVKLRS